MHDQNESGQFVAELWKDALVSFEFEIEPSPFHQPKAKALLC
jgi:hypothetical protein